MEPFTDPRIKKMLQCTRKRSTHMSDDDQFRQNCKPGDGFKNAHVIAKVVQVRAVDQVRAVVLSMPKRNPCQFEPTAHRQNIVQVYQS